jgi:hypothetical protein
LELTIGGLQLGHRHFERCLTFWALNYQHGVCLGFKVSKIA